MKTKKPNKRKRWKRAVAEGLQYHRAYMHVGHWMAFVGRNWEDSGFRGYLPGGGSGILFKYFKNFF